MSDQLPFNNGDEPASTATILPPAPEPPPTPEPPVGRPSDEAQRLTRYEGGAIQVRSLADMMQWANAVIASGFAPRGFRTASQVIVATQMGAEPGLGPMASLRSIYVPPSGRPALYAEAALALVLRSGQLEDYRTEIAFEDTPGLKATFHVKRRGHAWKSASFSLDDAKTAGLVKPDSGWQKYPKRMVLARSKAWALHDSFADLLLGVPIEGDGLDKLPPAAPPVAIATPVTVPPPPSEPDPLLLEAGE